MITYEKKDDYFTIFLTGEFTFNNYKEFRKVYSELLVPNVKIKIDFSSVAFIDSAAIGLLLILREEGSHFSAVFEFINVPHNIRSIFDIINLGKLFKY